ncbi:hypothetical protein AOX55_00005990 (plasmid) [Sinorhizobium fredii CCBAU 25509]|nr:hypothetical protein AOX55_00005990 [Sinorhizobium fredii CCBAU 25509]
MLKRFLSTSQRRGGSSMRRDMQRYMMIELIALIAALAVVAAVMVVTLLPG